MPIPPSDESAGFLGTFFIEEYRSALQIFTEDYQYTGVQFELVELSQARRKTICIYSKKNHHIDY